MNATPGEQLVGAYLKIVEGCDVVSYNVRPPGGGVRGLEEFDVLGLDFKNSTAFLCEVTTHIAGTSPVSIERLKTKHKRQRKYARDHLRQFTDIRYMFWSPRVPVGKQTKELAKLKKIEAVINADYAARIDELAQEATRRRNDEGNDAFRILQILAHLRR